MYFPPIIIASLQASLLYRHIEILSAFAAVSPAKTASAGHLHFLNIQARVSHKAKTIALAAISGLYGC
ncbi:MAG: hypothetical protein ACPGLY_06280 [Rubripirellula sp.]